MGSLKSDTNELIYDTEIDSQTQRHLWLENGKGKAGQGKTGNLG